MGANDILLGTGVFSINGVNIALTRGGGQFTINRKYKIIEADGDFGPVKGRQRKIESIAELKVNALELLPANLTDYFPAMNLNTADPAKDVLTAAPDIVDADYNTVAFTGLTKAGKQVYIELQNAINLEKLDWKLVDKDEVVPELTFTAHYLEAARTTEPWKVEFAKNASGDIVPPNIVLAAPKAGAKTQLVITFNEYLHADTLAITDRFNLLSALTNDALGSATPIAITTLAGSVQWYATATANPYAIITIASTTFVAGQTVRLNAKAAAIKDLAANAVLAATNFDAVVVA